MNTKEAAEFLGVSTSRIVKMIKAGKLPAEKIMGQWKIKKTDLKKLMIRGRGIRDYSVRIFFRKFKRGEKGMAPFLEARHGKSGYGKTILEMDLKNVLADTIEKTKNEMITKLQKQGYKNIYCDF